MEERKRLPEWLSWILVIVAALVVALIVRLQVVEFFQVPSGSMETTIMEGDRVVCWKLGVDRSSLERGQIVFFDNPSGDGYVLVKRVIATGGQVVDLQGGSVVVDGVALSEPYTNGQPSEPLSQTWEQAQVSFPYTVPEGYVWVMGDNRTLSRDSRYFGAIPTSSIIGVGVWTYWPFSAWGALE